MLAAGTPLRNIAERFATSATALHRHKAHIKAVLAKARETREVALEDSLADQMRSIDAKTLDLLSRAEEAGDRRTQLAAIREARANIGGLLTLQQAVGGGEKVILLVKDERDLPVGKPVPVVSQMYGTAESGNLGFECRAASGLHVPDGALVEVCSLDDGIPRLEGGEGQVVVTLFSAHYPLVRFGTGDLSAFAPGDCSCGRSTPRLVGWLGGSVA